jgi:hypothetical protein
MVKNLSTIQVEVSMISLTVILMHSKDGAILIVYFILKHLRGILKQQVRRFSLKTLVEKHEQKTHQKLKKNNEDIMKQPIFF